jgi:hypothetical protein
MDSHREKIKPYSSVSFHQLFFCSFGIHFGIDSLLKNEKLNVDSELKRQIYSVSIQILFGFPAPNI